MPHLPNHKEQLQQRIIDLESKQLQEWASVKAEASDLFDQLTPAHIVKNILVELTKAPEIKHNLMNSAIGMGAGYLSKRILFGPNPGKVMQVAGSFVEMSVAGIVAKNTDKLSEVILDKMTHWFSDTDVKGN
jgi:hypothetical protein